MHLDGNRSRVAERLVHFVLSYLASCAVAASNSHTSRPLICVVMRRKRSAFDADVARVQVVNLPGLDPLGPRARFHDARLARFDRADGCQFLELPVFHIRP